MSRRPAPAPEPTPAPESTTVPEPAPISESTHGPGSFPDREPVSVLGSIASLAAEKLAHPGPFEPGTRLVEDLDLDSIRLLTLAMEVEDHFRICLGEDDEASITTVGDLAAVVEAKLAEKSFAAGPPGSALPEKRGPG